MQEYRLELPDNLRDHFPLIDLRSGALGVPRACLKGSRLFVFQVAKIVEQGGRQELLDDYKLSLEQVQQSEAYAKQFPEQMVKDQYTTYGPSLRGTSE